MEKNPSARWPEHLATVAFVFGVLALGLIFAVSSASSATSTQQPRHDLALQGEQLNDPAELERFIDPMFAEHMEEHDIPGASFLVVRDGETFLSKGYGDADRENQIPVDPERTIFDLGSIGKLFTTTAVMQLVEQGRLDLDTDVNEYLTEFEIRDTYDEPITMSHLLTHTAGFDERSYIIGIVAPGPDETEPLAENLRKHLPPRIRPPGEVYQYSNAGMALAGHIVEQVSGQVFEDYVTENILEPLGMENSTYGLPQELVPDMATGYENLPEQAFSPYDTWHIHQKPAAGARATHADMAAFMIAHLNNGEYDGTRILEPETVELMHSLQFTLHPNVSGSAYGFMEHRAGDRRGLQHGGQWVGFSNLLYLLPDEDTGIIVSYNNGAGIYAQYELLEAILGRYFAVDEFARPEVFNGGEPTDLGGTYRTNRVDNHTFMSLPSMLGAQTIEVEALEDGEIEVSMSPELVPDGTWIEVEPGVFGELQGTNVLAFDEDGDRVHIGWPLLMTMDRVAWYQSSGLHTGLLVFFLLVLLSTAGWPIGRLYRRLRGQSFEMSQDLGRARLIGGVISGLIFAFLIGLLAYVATDLEGLAQVPTTFKLMLWLPIIAAVLAIALIVLVARLWMRSEGPLVSRVHLTVLAIALLGLFPFMYYWGLLGFHY